MNITMERIAPPALAPAVPLSPAQLAFLTLHVRHAVTAWRWHWCETLLRATAGKRTATLWRDEACELVALGLMEWGMGSQVKVTPAGVALAGREVRK